MHVDSGKNYRLKKTILARACEQLNTRIGYGEQLLRCGRDQLFWINDSRRVYSPYALEDRFQTATQELLEYVISGFT